MKTEATRMGQDIQEGVGRYPIGTEVRVEADAVAHSWTNAEPNTLMEQVLSRPNLMRAYQRVVSNKGAAGVDQMPVSALKSHLQQHWPTLRKRLLAGDYQPQPVRRISIPKPQGGERVLGIPTVQDRLIQQALHQVLSPRLDPNFSDHSYGFRPGRSPHQAVKAMQKHINEGRRWVVDLDLEKFFDRVNHDVLMSLLARRLSDRRILTLIRRYLNAGMLDGGLVSPRREGTPQGGPLSPLLSNVLLTELDRELERRGHRFCRYADDCNIYVRSERAGHRVMASITRYLEQRLRLRVNTDKSAVDRPWRRSYLGYSVSWHKQVRLRVAPKSLKRHQAKLRQLLRGARGRSLRTTIERLNPVLRGWANYYRLTDSKRPVEALDGWIRRRLRLILWRQWKRVVTRARNLMRLGLTEQRAWISATNGRGPWWNSGASHMNAALPKKVFDRLSLVSLLDTMNRLPSQS
ncbi:group II intron reverse transcriptase/maturase [Marinimicrobium sp. C6131]|uniref:group II intron reverse transcriptase/maturase n=1 Tax=Marinimicrobium sp. C6131 TaxID=3022676 RepID=UPI00223D3461|nr:group II intron reverse transcriptase/maturase [Marinimicrobium sp. C6131]UZJ43769.1 group II intron reverse transcriptase/maturase [Marinimicrobium sp. C6131]